MITSSTVPGFYDSPKYRKRVFIGAEALKHEGEHYLWGSSGEHPGVNDGAGYRDFPVGWETNELDKPEKTIVRAAFCAVDGRRVCTGRYGTFPGCRTFSAKDKDLLDYLNQVRAKRDLGVKPESWPAFFGSYTPRLANWKNDDNVMVYEQIWGQDCLGRRHFDCISFINYVLLKQGAAQSKDGQLDIKWYINNLEDASKQEPMPGDIVVRGTHHIGMLAEKRIVVHAFQSTDGVIREAYEPRLTSTDAAGKGGYSKSGNWDQRLRIPDNSL